MADLALTAAPIIAFITAYLQLSFIGESALNSALGMAILILSFPFHGYFLLGRQADERLPIGLRSWYREIEQKLKQVNDKRDPDTFGKEVQHKTNNKLTYFDLAVLLKRLFEPEQNR